MSPTITIDIETWMPLSLEYKMGDSEYEYTYDGWTENHKVLFPNKIETSVGSQSGWYEIDKIKPSLKSASKTYDPPSWSVDDDTKYDRSKSGKLETIQTSTGHILVKGNFAGGEPGWWLLDSGASGMVIDTDYADNFADRRFGQSTAKGAGGNMSVEFMKLQDFTVGPVTIDELVFADVNLP